ncbi:class I SAM-dependent methyltransferase [Streptomyces sp. NPDC001139]
MPAGRSDNIVSQSTPFVANNDGFERYPLGHTEREMRRLEYQSILYADVTRAFLAGAGIKQGMTVLDLGCGAGDVSFIAAKLVGPDGAVRGLDNSQSAIRTAKRRAAGMQINNVEFIEADLDDFDPPRDIDAVIGRMVLAYISDPGALLSKIISSSRRPAIIGFQEINLSHYYFTPSMPLHSKSLQWIHETFERAGLCADSGLRLPTLLRKAGLENVSAYSTARVETAENSVAAVYFSETVRSMLPLMVSLGVVTEEEVDITTLGDRLTGEMQSRTPTLVLPAMVSASAMTPSI